MDRNIDISELNEKLSDKFNSDHKKNVFILSKVKKINNWTIEEDSDLLKYAAMFEYKNWNAIAEKLPGRSAIQCSARYKRIKPGLTKGAWTEEEDEQLIKFIKKFGKNWSLISKYMSSRSGKQIRDRYLNTLDPNILKEKFTSEEDDKILECYSKFGSQWSKIAKQLPRRTGDMIKNRFYSSLRKKIHSEDYRKSLKIKKSINQNNIKDEDESLHNDRLNSRNLKVNIKSENISSDESGSIYNDKEFSKRKRKRKVLKNKNKKKSKNKIKILIENNNIKDTPVNKNNENSIILNESSINQEINSKSNKSLCKVNILNNQCNNSNICNNILLNNSFSAYPEEESLSNSLPIQFLNTALLILNNSNNQNSNFNNLDNFNNIKNLNNILQQNILNNLIIYKQEQNLINNSLLDYHITKMINDLLQSGYLNNSFNSRQEIESQMDVLKKLLQFTLLKLDILRNRCSEGVDKNIKKED
jgi:hypothetical protein